MKLWTFLKYAPFVNLPYQNAGMRHIAPQCNPQNIFLHVPQSGGGCWCIIMTVYMDLVLLRVSTGFQIRTFKPPSFWLRVHT